jgi:hypothetical protein
MEKIKHILTRYILHLVEYEVEVKHKMWDKRFVFLSLTKLTI